jgi:hypothetical protein
VEKYYTAIQAADDNTTRRTRFACWVPKATDTRGICNAYYFSTATMVSQIRLNVTFVPTLPVLLTLKPVGVSSKQQALKG